PSPVGANSRAKKLSTSARTRAASAFSSPAERSIVSTGIERLEAGRLAVATECDLLDPRLCILQPGFTVALQPVALLVKLDRAVAFEARVRRRWRARRLGRLGDRCIELPLRGETERHRILGGDIRHVPVGPVADRCDGGARGADQLADLPIGDLGVVLDDPVN